MSLAQDKWVLAATVIAESAWLYAAFGVVGLPVAGTGSPLGWFAVLAVLASSLIVARVLQVIVLPAAVAPGIYAVLGILVIYLTFGGQFTAGNSFDLFWVGQLTQEVQAQNFWASVVVAAVMASGLWWRGGALASAEYPDEVLLLSFKIGIVALGIAVVMDAAYSADLNTYPMMFIFIASALGGLAIGRLSPSSARTATKRAWPRVIGGVVSAVLVLGLVFGIVQSFLLPFVSRTIQSIWLLLADYVVGPVITVLILPIAWLVNFFFAWIISLFGELPEVEPDPEAPFSRFEALEEPIAGLDVPAEAEIAGWVVVAILLTIALVVVMIAYQKRSGRRRPATAGTRESVRSQADPLYDVAKLLFNLLPERFRKRGQMRPYTLPQGDPGVVDALRMYYRLLTIGEKKGVARSPSETPTEFQGKLEKIFPPDLVSMVTAAFDRACYGYHPSSEEHLGQMRALFEQLEPGH